MLLVTLRGDTDRAGYATGSTFACSILFKAVSLASFGTSPKCSFDSRSVVRVVFGRKATLMPGSHITVVDTPAVWSSVDYRVRMAGGTTIAVTSSTTLPELRKPVLSAPSTTPACVDLVVDGSYR